MPPNQRHPGELWPLCGMRPVLDISVDTKITSVWVQVQYSKRTAAAAAADAMAWHGKASMKLHRLR
jgi:hypothetical protein